MLTRYIVLSPLLALLIALPSQAQEWQWAQRGGGTGGDFSYAVTVDASGNAYVTGGFEGTVDFGPFALTSTGGLDMFVVKYAPTGDVLWARGGGGPATVEGSGVAVDASGNVYVVGGFVGSATFGSVTLTSTGGADAFVVKLSAEGDVLWARRGGSSGFELPWAGVTLDVSGNAYIAGEFSGTAAFGSFTLTSVGQREAFLARYSTSGEVLWAQQSTSPGGEARARGVAAELGGSVVVAESFMDTTTFGTHDHVSAGPADADVFITHYAPSGDVLRALRAGDNGDDAARAVAAGADGDAYVTGGFGGTAAFGPLEVTSAGSIDVFLAKMEPLAVSIEPGISGGAALAVYPNPASAAATVWFTLARPGPFRLSLYDVLGREVVALVEGTRTAGEHSVSLDASRLPSGLYLLRLATESGSLTRRVTVLR